MPNYLFFDIDSKLLAAYETALTRLTPKDCKYIGGSVKVITEPTDVRKIGGIDVYVSPANSYGWMDGGIDAVYSKMWPDVGSLVQTAIRERSPLRTVYDRFALPVGSALLVDLGPGREDRARKAIICAPTMMTPRNISRSPENIYFAMYAILCACEHLGSEYTVGVPGLGTGVGGVSGEDSALEILRAFTDYSHQSAPDYPAESTIKRVPGTYLVTPPFLD